MKPLNVTRIFPIAKVTFFFLNRLTKRSVRTGQSWKQSVKYLSARRTRASLRRLPRKNCINYALSYPAAFSPYDARHDAKNCARGRARSRGGSLQLSPFASALYVRARLAKVNPTISPRFARFNAKPQTAFMATVKTYVCIRRRRWKRRSF